MSAEQAYLFRHAVVRDAAYQLQLPSVRRGLHGHAANILEAMHGGAPPPLQNPAAPHKAHPVDSVAHEIYEHLRLSLQSAQLGQRARTVLEERVALYAYRAARFAEEHFQFAEALRLYEQRARRRGASDASRARDLTRAATMATFLYDNARAGLLSREGLEAASASGDEILVGMATTEVARVVLLGGDAEKAIGLYSEALVHLRNAGDGGRIGTALASIAIAEHQLGRTSDAAVHYQQALAVHRAAGDRSGEGSTLSNFANLHMTANEHELARAEFMEAIAIARETNNLRGEGYALGNLGELYLKMRREREAEQYLTRALEVHTRAGNREQEAWIASRLALFSVERKELARAESLYRRALMALEGTDKREWIGAMWSKLAVMFYEANRTQEAEAARKESESALLGNQSNAALCYAASIFHAREAALRRQESPV